MLSQSCLQLLSSWIQWEARSALPRDHSKLSLSYPKVIPRLSQSYLKVVSELPQDNQLGSVVRPGLFCPGTTTSGSWLSLSQNNESVRLCGIWSADATDVITLWLHLAGFIACEVLWSCEFSMSHFWDLFASFQLMGCDPVVILFI